MRARCFPPILLTLFALFNSGVWAQAEELVLLQFQRNGTPLPPVVIGLFEADAPRHATNFKRLVATGFYKKTSVHRVASERLVQLGDPLSRSKDSPDIGTGGPGYTLPPEVMHRHTAGSVAMARLPDRINPSRLSNGSQFYVALRPLPELDGTDTVFGRVESGIDVLLEMSRVPADTNEIPLDRITVKRTKLVPREKLNQELSAWGASAARKESWWGRKFGKLWPF
jgi:peptidyl-prolyl cis-trans isomerase B (cyclophilin B)